MSPSSTAYAEQMVRTFITQLRASGVQHVVIAPGSRSTPLTYAFARDASFTPWLHLDERSAGYFALGLARQLRAPVALVCTSGTAAANFAPAVAEAWLSRLPLVLLTADRPPELRGIGANQTIEQVGMYGAHVKLATELPIADGTESLLRQVRSTAARMVALAIEAPAGPVHINVPFREPLLDPSVTLPALPAVETIVVQATVAGLPSVEAMERIAAECLGRRGLIICGPESYGLPAPAITALAAVLGWPVLPDPLSGLRSGVGSLDHIVATYDPLLRSARFVAEVDPELVLRFGGTMASSPLQQFLAFRRPRQIVVDAPGGWRDADAEASIVVHADTAAFCDSLSRIVSARRGATGHEDGSWLATWMDADRTAREAIRLALEAIDEPFEGRVSVELADALPDGATLVIGNSMAIRDAEAFYPARMQQVRLVGTRGASGIDGVVSTAAGAAAAADGPVALVIGDLSFFHDLNGLWAVQRHQLSLTVLLVNNDGGGIFHFLSQAESAKDEFEEWWGTPHGLEFRHAVEMYGGTYERLSGATGWAPRVAEALQRPGLTVLELRTDRVRNVPLHREVWARVHAALRATLGEVPDGASMPAAGGLHP